jgi:hypothetical protein
MYVYTLYIYIIHTYIHIYRYRYTHLYIYIHIYVSNWNHRVALSASHKNSSRKPLSFDADRNDASTPQRRMAQGIPRGCIPLLGAMVYPLVNVYITMERSTIFNGKTHYKWPFSIAMLNYQRVS